jgi:ornithine cyclodeaminase
MIKTYDLNQIKKALETIDPIQSIEEGFVAYSEGKVVVPPVGEMIFENPPGDVHIKYGYIRDDDYYVIKIASGFYENVKLGLPTTKGMMLLFNQKTGEPFCFLLDEGYLTEVRTAAAGAVVAKYLAPKHVDRIGIFGSGTQGRMQLLYLNSIIPCRDVVVWGRHEEKLKAYKKDVEPKGYTVHTTLDAAEVASLCNLIVMATPSKKPLLSVDDIREGTHITAMGSDTADKIELDPKILGKADLVVADSIQQCLSRGEIFQAIQAKRLVKENVVELGHVIAGHASRRTSEEQITVADLTGVAVQDIQISKAVFEKLNR